MNHIEEFKRDKTISGWSEDEILNGEVPESIQLKYKDVKGETTLEEKVSIEIENLLLYNNVDYISPDEILETSQDIIKLIKKQNKK